MTLVERLRSKEGLNLSDEIALKAEAADRIEALTKALREIELHLEAHPRPSQRVDNALAIARTALGEEEQATAP